MGYLSVVNFWKYQNADVWKKSKIHPPWFKHYVQRDMDLDHMSVGARLLFWELVGAATRYSNVLEDDLNWLWAETRIDPETIAEELPKLVKGGWLSQTQSRRRSRKILENPREDPLEPVEVEVEVEVEETPKGVSSSTPLRSEETDAAAPALNGRAALPDDIPLPDVTAPPTFPCPHCNHIEDTWSGYTLHLTLDHADLREGVT
jgi:hypothetical protein